MEGLLIQIIARRDANKQVTMADQADQPLRTKDKMYRTTVRIFEKRVYKYVG
jgi:hypothetical protein